LGTTYIENFNGIKDILPILQRNIPRALGMKESILENIIDEIKHLPDDLHALRETLRRASRGELMVELSPLQLESIGQNLQNALRPIVMALMLALGAMGAWMGGLEEIAYGLLGAAIMRLWYR